MVGQNYGALLRALNIRGHKIMGAQQETIILKVYHTASHFAFFEIGVVTCNVDPPD